MDKSGLDVIGRTATVQGTGVTETGSLGTLLETNVTVISNELCREIFHYNQTLNKAIERQINTALPNGLDDGFLCSQGHMNRYGVITAPCKGDAGAPLTLHDDMGKQTLIGVVSGGVGCGRGVPSWYSKVSHYYPWIDCVIQTSRDNMGKVDIVREKCDKVARDLVPCIPSDDDFIFGLPLCKN